MLETEKMYNNKTHKMSIRYVTDAHYLENIPEVQVVVQLWTIRWYIMSRLGISPFDELLLIWVLNYDTWSHQPALSVAVTHDAEVSVCQLSNKKALDCIVVQCFFLRNSVILSSCDTQADIVPEELTLRYQQ